MVTGRVTRRLPRRASRHHRRPAGRGDERRRERPQGHHERRPPQLPALVVAGRQPDRLPPQHARRQPQRRRLAHGLGRLLAAPAASPSPATSATRRSRPTAARLAFTTHATTPDDVEIAVAAVGSGVVTVLTDNAVFDSSPCWSPDGRRIAFERGPAGDDPGNDVWSMAADGTDQRQLTTTAGLDEGPSWSPSGSRIAFTSTRAGSSDIWTMAADGSDQRSLAALPGGTKEESPDWQSLPVAGPPVTTPGPGRQHRLRAPTGGDRPRPRRAQRRARAPARDLTARPRQRRRRAQRRSRGAAHAHEPPAPRQRSRRASRRARARRDARDRRPSGAVRGTAASRFRADADPRTHTNPRRRDTDGDGVSDGREDRNHNGRVDRGERDPLSRRR